jgi:hypothetical protein
MKTLRTTSLLTPLAAAVLLAGCFSAGVQTRNRDRDRDSDRDEVEDSRPREVRGIVEGIDPVNHRIDIGEGEGIHAIYYDSFTRLEHETRHFRPQDLRRGDRIRAEVQPTAAGLIVQQIEVLSAGREGTGPEVLESPEAREAPERREAPETREIRDDSRPEESLRGVVRYVDLSASSVEIETPPAEHGRPGRVRVRYDADTAVEFQGKPFSPENLQLGDRVEIALRGHGGPPLARRIVILAGESTENH